MNGPRIKLRREKLQSGRLPLLNRSKAIFGLPRFSALELQERDAFSKSPLAVSFLRFSGR